MSAVKRGARAGVAAFALGLSLAGPQAVGIAAADPADADGPSASAESSAPANDAPAPSRASRADRSSDSTDAGPRGGSADAAPAADAEIDVPDVPETPEPTTNRRTSDRQSTDVRTADSDNAAPAAAAPAPAPSASSATATESDSNAPVPAVDGLQQVSAPAAAAAVTAGNAGGALGGNTVTPRPAASIADLFNTPDIFTTAPPALAQPIATIGAAVTNFFDTTANWISGLPGGPITEFLEGALLLARRTFFQAFPALNVGHTTGQAADQAYFTDAQLRDYLLGLAKQQYGDLFGTTVPVYGYGPYGPYPEYYKTQASTAGGTQSDTNTQVNGVDEADFVENDGNYIYTAHNGRLTITRADLSVASESQLSGDVVGEYLAGDKLTVITQSGGGWYGPMVKMAYPGYWGPWKPQTTVTVYDVADRTAPTVLKTTVFDGAYQDSRAIDGVVYVVTQRSVNLPAPSYTDVPIEYISGTTEADLAGEAKMIRYDPSAPIAYRTYETWDAYVARVGDQIVDLSLPHAYRVEADGTTVDLGLLTGAQDIVKPHADNQQSLLSVATVDANRGAAGPAFNDSVASMVASQGATVYMTKDALYIATPEDHYTDSGYSSDTRIDRFKAAGAKVSWKATGLVSGTLINQFAMDESDGYLRVTTHTNSAQWGDGTATTRNDNGIYVLDTAGRTLDEVGRLTGLAPGEELYAVRYVGDTAYLVTFVRTDPLFAVDLSDPTAPTLKGELVVPGFSNYLQSVGDGLLLGIGQEREAGSWNTHVHASLFDVRDGANMSQIDREFLDPGYQWSWSDAQFDHHALLYSAQDGLLVVPVSGSGYDPETGYKYGQYLKVLRVGPAGIEVVGEIHPDEPTLRTVRIGDVLYAVGDTSVTAYQISDLSEIGRSTSAPSVV